MKGARDSMAVAETVSTSATRAVFTDDMVDAMAFWRAYAGERKLSPSQLLWLELLWITVGDIEKGDTEAYCWVRGDYDGQLRWIRTRLGDVLGYCGLDQFRSLRQWRLALLGRFGKRPSVQVAHRATARRAVTTKIGSSHKNRWALAVQGK